MNSRFLLSTAALLLLTIFLFFGVAEWQEPHGPERDGASDDGRESAGNSSVVGGASPGNRQAPGPPEVHAGMVDSEVAIRAEQRVRDLEATLVLVQTRLEEAEQGLAESEIEVAELERMIAQIKARGEDPAEYGGIAMERFQPAFFRFQDAQAAYVNAGQLKAETESALEAARTELARHRSSDSAGNP